MTTDDSLLILGRQPALGLAELESLYGAEKLRPVGNEAALLAVKARVMDFARLGGSIKLCEVVATFDTIKWPDLQAHLEQLASELLSSVSSDGKIKLGISAFGLGIGPRQLTAAGLNIKKLARASGRSVRLVPNQTSALNSAQVLHNHLTGPLGCEIVLVRDGAKTICARTVAEQDIASYTLRDRGRPKRDARVGMLPPKLAQIIINLAIGEFGSHESSIRQAQDRRVTSYDKTVLDPFCGTGVILQEALLMGFSVYGSDIEARMVDYTSTNIGWVYADHHDLQGFLSLDTGDATTHKWEKKFQFVASETYLGQPFSALPSREKLEQVRGTCNAIIEKFLANIGRQLKPGMRLCLAMPAWQISPDKFRHLPLIDRLDDLRYNRVSFEHVRDDQLLYYREGQIVARELLVLTRK